MPILTLLGGMKKRIHTWHDGRTTHSMAWGERRGMTVEIQNYDDKIVVSSSRLGKVSKLPLLSLTRNFTLFFIPCYCPLSNQKYQKISLKKGHFATE